MMKWMLAAGAAALAISAPIAAERGGGKGGQRGQTAQVEKGDRGGGQARAQRGGGNREVRSTRGGGNREVRAQRGGGSREFRAPRGGGNREVRVERRGGNREMRAQRVERGDRSRARSFGLMQSDNRGRGRGRDDVRSASRGQDRARAVRIDNDRGRGRADVRREASGNDRARALRFDDRGRSRDDSRLVRLGRDGDGIRGRGNARVADFNGDRVFRVRDVDRRGVVRFRDIDRDDLFIRRLGYGDGGCPPGLAKKGNGCMPPGQAARFIGQPLVAATRFGALDPLPLSMRSLYWDNDDYYYRYGGGYLYRVDRDRDLIDGMLPLFGAALLGQQLSPHYVNSYYRPPYYSAFYPNSPYDCYQYGYGYVYETDCASGLVEDVIPTYDYGYGVGQMLPASYGYYNLPYTYRSSFIDDDDYYYRYAPGAIYQVDRDSALVSAVVALLTNGLTVGQPLPMGYSAYNVPMAYRTSYYDTPDAWYRYDNGYIYAVDPHTRVVRNVAYAII